VITDSMPAQYIDEKSTLKIVKGPINQ